MQSAMGGSLPNDLKVALSEHAGAQQTWDRLSDADRKAHIADLESSSDDYARERCLESLVHDLELQPPGRTR